MPLGKYRHEVEQITSTCLTPEMNLSCTWLVALNLSHEDELEMEILAYLFLTRSLQNAKR